MTSTNVKWIHLIHLFYETLSIQSLRSDQLYIVDYHAQLNILVAIVENNSIGCTAV